jgi:arginine/ornithine N-succinyltransferase beta subunit
VELEPVKNLRSYTTVAGEPEPERARAYLIARTNGREFRAVRADAELNEKGRLVVAPAVLKAIGVEPKSRVDCVPLP